MAIPVWAAVDSWTGGTNMSGTDFAAGFFGTLGSLMADQHRVRQQQELEERAERRKMDMMMALEEFRENRELGTGVLALGGNSDNMSTAERRSFIAQANAADRQAKMDTDAQAAKRQRAADERAAAQHKAAIRAAGTTEDRQRDLLENDPLRRLKHTLASLGGDPTGIDTEDGLLTAIADIRREMPPGATQGPSSQGTAAERAAMAEVNALANVQVDGPTAAAIRSLAGRRYDQAMREYELATSARNNRNSSAEVRNAPPPMLPDYKAFIRLAAAEHLGGNAPLGYEKLDEASEALFANFGLSQPD